MARNKSIVLIVIVLIVLGFLIFNILKIDKGVNNFESCAEVGNLIMNSYPRQCNHDGVNYVEKLSFEDDGIILMRNSETGEYGCFGCNNELCVDPYQFMKQVDESVVRYCDEDFKVVPSNGKDDDKEKIYCDEDSRKGDACIALYDPVCGWNNGEKIQCIKWPCASTYSNSCHACHNEDVLYWTEGECPR